MHTERRPHVRHVFKAMMMIQALLLVPSCSAAGEGMTISLISDKAPGLAVRHGLGKVTSALQARGVTVRRGDSLDAAGGKTLIVAGTRAGAGAAAKLHETLGVAMPEGAETLQVRRTRWNGRDVLLVGGGDGRGLMYALLDVADRIGWAEKPADPLSEVRDAAEAPAVPERALSIYTMHQASFEKRLHDEKQWAKYLDMLAANRFNTFVLILGYSPSNHLSPPYPYFFDVEGFGEVRAPGVTADRQRRDLAALNRVIRMTHERGLSFTLGIWDHIGQGRKPFPGTPTGLSRKNLVPYTKAAVAKLLKVVPDMDAIQFRLHWESGIRRDEMDDFWPEVFRIIKDTRPGIRIDARAKGLPDSVIDRALELGINIRITTKYWMEQMGMPFHPTHINPKNQRDRRHGYADLLRYPRRYKMHWKLWNGGTTRVLLWGSPEYVRRFAGSTHLYDGDGFEVNEPLATKLALFPGADPYDLLRPKYRYYEYEFERYWHFFQVFGRVGYNPRTPPEVWRRQFQRRFGKAAAPHVERGLHRAGLILPLIVAYSYPYKFFPTLTGWPEMRRQGDLPTYAGALPSDTQQFQSIDEAARYRLEGKVSAKMHPGRSADRFARLSREVLECVRQAEQRIGKHTSREFVSTMVDLRILAGLALYHSRRARAGLSLAMFKHSQDANALDDAIRHEGEAIEAWEGIVAAAGDVYHDNLMMGRGLSGHWKDELEELKSGLKQLRRQRGGFKPPRPKAGPRIAHVPVRRALPGADLVLRATVSAKGGVRGVRVVLGRDSVEMKRTRPNLYSGTIPAAKVAGGLSYFIEATDGAGRRATWPRGGRSAAVAVAVTDDRAPPAVTHAPVRTAAAGKHLTVTAKVTDPSGVRWVRLRYRSVTQFEDYRTLQMKRTGRKDEYAATVPADHVPAEWDFMYLIEVMDRAGNGAIHPDLERQTPYVVVKLNR